MNTEKETFKLLVVEDDDLVLQGFVTVLKEEGYEVVGTNNGSDAIDLVEEDGFDLVLVDLMMEGIDGLGVLRGIKKISPETIVIIITGFESMESALEAMRYGAYDYLIKPCPEIDLKMTIKRGLDKSSMERRLVDAERLAAITETALAANREMKDPLSMILAEIESLLKKKGELDKETKKRLEVIMKEASRIRDVIKKMSTITKPIISQYIKDIKMIDIKKSKNE